MALEIGTIMVGAYHYASRHPYWYVVKEISPSRKTCIVHRVKDCVVSHDCYGQNGTMTCYLVDGKPIEDEYYRDVRCTLKEYEDGSVYVNHKKFRIYLSAWDGTPEDFFTD